MSAAPKSFYGLFEAACTRVDQMVWLDAVLWENENVSDAFADFCEELTGGEPSIVAAFPFLSGLVARTEDVDEDGGFKEYADDVMRNFVDAHARGFLAQIARPVMRYGADGGALFSWGHQHTGWIFGATLDDLVAAAETWAAARDAEDRAKAPKGPSS